jgi:K+ transporter
MLRKYIVPIVALVIIITLFVMYRGQNRLNRKTLQSNYSLVSQLNELRQKDQQLRQGMEQIQQARQQAPQLQGTFVDRKKYFRQNWKNYIHVSLNDYKTGFLGGVKDIRVIVYNDSVFPLDNVLAVLRYYRANGKLFKTENININNIAGKSSKSAEAPDSRRGLKITLQLQRITSQQMNFCWSADKKVAPGDQDPYQCATTANGHYNE